MAKRGDAYTYRGGKKLRLAKEPDKLVTRLLPDEVEDMGLEKVEEVSSHSTRVTVTPPELESVMARMRAVAPTHHAYELAETGEEFLITDRVLVTFRRPLSSDELAGFINKYALIQRERYSDRDFLFQLTDHTGMNPVKLVVKLMEEESALVENAENDLNQRAAPAMPLLAPTDPHYFRQWYLHTRATSADFDPRSSTNCEQAWQALGGYGSADVVIGITDDGCKLDHGDFDATDKFAGWAYFQGTRLVTNTDIDAQRTRMYTVGENHGTSCAGVAAGEADAQLTVGAAPGCRLLPVKWELSGGYLLTADSKLLTLLNYVTDKVDILSNSWGRVPSSLHATLVLRRIRELAESGGRRGKGIVFLFAAGNENCPLVYDGPVSVPYSDGWKQQAGGSVVWEGPRTSRKFQNDLTDVPGVAHVAALASTARRSHYSNYGAGVTLCAPSSNSHAYWRADVPGLSVTTATGTPSGVTHAFGGTSSATPLVAGIAALVISANPELNATQVLSVLKRTASKDLGTTPYSRTPAASFDSDTSWDVSPVAPFDNGAFVNTTDPDGTWSPWFGHGRVDARAAVLEAMRLRASAGGARQFRSQPALPIPDNRAGGITDEIRITEPSIVRRIAVDVSIAHPWIGDLRVRLLPPGGGTGIVLHNRTGEGKDHLRVTFDETTTPALATLHGAGIQGAWRLVVEDLAPYDEGTLESWGLTIVTEAATNRLSDEAGLHIPDADPGGITRTIDVPDAELIRDIVVGIEITHPWLADLRVTLVAPGQAEIALPLGHSAERGRITRVWRSQDYSALRALRGKNPLGAWQLKVIDRLRHDEGRLDRWYLEIAR